MIILFGKWVRQGQSLRSTAAEIHGGKLRKTDQIHGDLTVPVFECGRPVGKLTLRLENGQPVATISPVSSMAPILVALGRVGLGAWKISSATKSSADFSGNIATITLEADGLPQHHQQAPPGARHAAVPT